MPSETEIGNALNVLRDDYWDDVRGVVDNLKFELKQGNVDRTYDAVTGYLEQTCDGHQRVIYTREAILTLLFSENDDAIEEYGVDHVTNNGAINYSALAYFAFYADVLEQAAAEGVAPHQIEDAEEEEEEAD